MNAIARPLPVLNGRALPPRLLERLWDGDWNAPAFPDGWAAGLSADALRPRATSGCGDAHGEFEPMSAFLDAAEQLYGRISAALAGTGLSYAEYQLLANLVAATGPVDTAALALAAAFPPSGVACLVDRLARAGLLFHSGSGSAGRVAITPAGSAAAARGASALDDIASRFIASLSGAESAALDVLLARLLR